MREQANKKARRKSITAYIPELLVLLVCGLLLLDSISQKQGFHMDELLSFELANAEFNPWIVPTQPQGRLAKFVENELRGESAGETVSNLWDTVQDVLQNRGSSKLLSYKADVYEEPVWIDRQTFEDYITVGEEDGFSYLSVYFNVKDDNHPPLHFMILHTISSLFRGELTPLMGCAINLVCVLGIMILLMYLGRQIMKIWGQEQWGRIAGLLAAGSYGLSIGAVSTTLLIRMYAMVTFFCVALLAIHVRKLYSYLLGGSDFTEHNKLLILVTVLGFWTQYFFLFYCLILSAVTVVILCVQKRKKGLLCYIRSMMLAAVIGVGLFPFSISDVFSSGRGVEALENLSAGLSGYGSRIASFLEIVIKEVGWGMILLPLAILILAVGKVMNRGKIRNGAGLQCLLWIPPAGYFLLASRMSPYLVDRYVMPLFPLVTLAVMVLVCKALATVCLQQGKEKGTRVVATVLGIVLAVSQFMSMMGHESPYQYAGYDVQRKVAVTYRESPCICVYQGVGYYENLLEFAEYDRTLLVTAEELAGRKEQASIQSVSEAIVLIKYGVEEDEIRRLLEEQYGLHVQEVLQEDGLPYGDTLLRVTSS